MNELLKTRQRVLKLRAHNPDALEDYFHDAVVRVLQYGKPLEEWLPYLYKSVSMRIRYGREDQSHAPLIEETLPEQAPENVSLKLDIERALQVLSPQCRLYIYHYFYEGQTLAEIARHYKVTSASVQQVIQTGLRRMKQVLIHKEDI